MQKNKKRENKVKQDKKDKIFENYVNRNEKKKY